MRIRYLVLFVVFFTLFTVSGWAGLISINNAGFENPVPAAGWTGTGIAGAMNQVAGLSAHEGTRYLFIDNGTESQVLGDSLLTSTSYSLVVWVGLRGDLICRLTGCVATPTIELFAGTTSLGTASGTLPTAGTFSPYTLNFTTGASVPNGLLRIVLSATRAETNFDAVSLNAGGTPPTDPSGVPEPSAMVLLAAGLVGLITRHKMAKVA